MRPFRSHNTTQQPVNYTLTPGMEKTLELRRANSESPLRDSHLILLPLMTGVLLSLLLFDTLLMLLVIGGGLALLGYIFLQWRLSALNERTKESIINLMSGDPLVGRIADDFGIPASDIATALNHLFLWHLDDFKPTISHLYDGKQGIRLEVRSTFDQVSNKYVTYLHAYRFEANSTLVTI